MAYKENRPNPPPVQTIQDFDQLYLGAAKARELLQRHVAGEWEAWQVVGGTQLFRPVWNVYVGCMISLFVLYEFYLSCMNLFCVSCMDISCVLYAFLCVVYVCFSVLYEYLMCLVWIIMDRVCIFDVLNEIVRCLVCICYVLNECSCVLREMVMCLVWIFTCLVCIFMCLL